jgi:hypothetical protein
LLRTRAHTRVYSSPTYLEYLHFALELNRDNHTVPNYGLMPVVGTVHSLCGDCPLSKPLPAVPSAVSFLCLFLSRLPAVERRFMLPVVTGSSL